MQAEQVLVHIPLHLGLLLIFELIVNSGQLSHHRYLLSLGKGFPFKMGEGVSETSCVTFGCEEESLGVQIDCAARQVLHSVVNCVDLYHIMSFSCKESVDVSVVGIQARLESFQLSLL